MRIVVITAVLGPPREVADSNRSALIQLLEASPPAAGSSEQYLSYKSL